MAEYLAEDMIVLFKINSLLYIIDPVDLDAFPPHDKHSRKYYPCGSVSSSDPLTPPHSDPVNRPINLIWHILLKQTVPVRENSEQGRRRSFIIIFGSSATMIDSQIMITYYHDGQSCVPGSSAQTEIRHIIAPFIHPRRSCQVRIAPSRARYVK